MFVAVDDPLDQGVLERVRQVDGITEARLVELPP